jgi:hypothetical protein
MEAEVLKVEMQSECPFVIMQEIHKAGTHEAGTHEAGIHRAKWYRMFEVSNILYRCRPAAETDT